MQVLQGVEWGGDFENMIELLEMVNVCSSPLQAIVRAREKFFVMIENQASLVS